MQKYFWLIVLSVLILAAPGGGGTRQLFDPEEYHLYSCLLRDWYGDGPESILIRDVTGVHRQRMILEKELALVMEKIPLLKQKTINDFKAKNTLAYSLDDFLMQNAHYKPISTEEIEELFTSRLTRENRKWEEFGRRHLNSEGILTFSRAGVNPERTQGLVYIANQWDKYAGSGVYIVFTKQADGTWAPYKEFRAWDSWNPEEITP